MTNAEIQNLSPENLREEAEKLESSKGGFFAKLFDGCNGKFLNDKLEEACEKYRQAGSRFKSEIL